MIYFNNSLVLQLHVTPNIFGGGGMDLKYFLFNYEEQTIFKSLNSEFISYLFNGFNIICLINRC